MQQEIDAAGWPLEVVILGVNQAGHEGGNAAACAGKDLPWLQENAGDNVWGAWEIDYRDVVICNEENERVVIYNLTTHDLSVPANFAELKQLLQTAAGVP